MPLNPQRLTPTASLNRVPFIAGPEVSMPPEYEGRSAYSLLGAGALAGHILEHRQELELTTEEIAAGALSHALQARLRSPEPAVATTAAHTVAEYGRRLGYLVALLKRGDAESREARPEWDESYWAHWASIERVYIGGGLAWPGVCDAASAVVQILSPGIKVSLPPAPAYLPLIGAARSLHTQGGKALVLDFGQTVTKRAVAAYENGRLTSITALQPVPASTLNGLDYIRWIARTAASSLPTDATATGLCVSSYLDEQGHPARYAMGGRFAAIHDQIQNLPEWLTVEVSQAAGRDVKVVLFHDSTAAGIGLSPAPSAAAMMLGTALGVGFPRPEDRTLVPVAPDLSVDEARLSP